MNALKAMACVVIIVAGGYGAGWVAQMWAAHVEESNREQYDRITRLYCAAGVKDVCAERQGFDPPKPDYSPAKAQAEWERQNQTWKK